MSMLHCSALASIAGLAAVASTASAAVQVTSLGTSAPPASIGGYAMQAFGFDGRSIGPEVSDVGVADGSPFGAITFSQPLSHYQIGNGWGTWSNGYTGDVYASLGNLPVTIELAPGTTAFSLYVEPNDFGVHGFTVTCGGVAFGSAAEGFAGAVGVGFYTTDGTALPSITVSFVGAADGFAIGQFAAAVPGPATLAIFGLAGLGRSRRRQA